MFLRCRLSYVKSREKTPHSVPTESYVQESDLKQRNLIGKKSYFTFRMQNLSPKKSHFGTRPLKEGGTTAKEMSLRTNRIQAVIRELYLFHWPQSGWYMEGERGQHPCHSSTITAALWVPKRFWRNMVRMVRGKVNETLALQASAPLTAPLFSPLDLT